MEKIQAPISLKKILAAIGNIVLFIVYYLLLSFLSGLVLGVVEAIMSTKYDKSIYSVIALFALVVTIVGSIFLRKKIFFHVIVDKEEPAELN